MKSSSNENNENSMNETEMEKLKNFHKLVSNQEWRKAIRNKLKKKFNSSIGRRQFKKKSRADKPLRNSSSSITSSASYIISSSNNNSKDSGLSITEKNFDSNLLSSTSIGNSNTYFSIDFLHEGFYSDNSDFSDDSFISVDDTTKLELSFSSIDSKSSLESVGEIMTRSIRTNITEENESRIQSSLHEITNESNLKYAKTFHPLISSSRVSLINHQAKVRSEYALPKKLAQFKTSSRKSLLNEPKKPDVSKESISIDENDLLKFYSMNFYEHIHMQLIDTSNESNTSYENVCSSTLLSIRNKHLTETKQKSLNFSEFLKNEIYKSYF